ncbi:Hsp70 family protein [Histoplasma capsulatum G186AR]|uniref:Hsp70 family protein n=1 Tax=Ajellomyces capsulatus TaxID=5037 RepID=A0A8H7ZAD4_AJECA|nr:Hsp70 family protein [Histoplasma capsulatum]QSS76418.1 Hsp70 family protein [Histoplasma capsulatum G186AR]
MSDRFGDAFDNLPMKRKGPGSELMNKFEVIKKDFGHSNDPTIFELPLNMNAPHAKPEYFDDEERIVLLSSEDLQSVFEPVVEQILSLVREQIQDARKATGHRINRIILVGGFGDSEYLRRKFRSSFESMDIAVTVPDKPQATIVQGAALRGLEGIRSTTKKCRRHYGFRWGLPFRDGIDAESEAFIDVYTGEKMVGGIMKWMICKGEKYSENYTCMVPVARTHYQFNSLKRQVTLYACDLTDAPERGNPDCYVVGEIEVNFSNADLNEFPSKYIDGWRVYLLKYTLKVIFGAQDGVLKFEAASQGKTIGRTSINFNTIKYY